MTKVAELKIDTIRKWWKSVEKAESQNKLIDTHQFADIAHEAIPALLKELERLKEKAK